jgi:putative heme-binding domain-containing protein
LLLPAFDKSRTEKVGLALVAGLKRLPGPSLSAGQLDRVLAGYPDEVHRSFRHLREALLARNQEEWRNLDRVGKELVPGNSPKGLAVFRSDRTGCTACHRAAGQGGGLGPNLSRIGVIRNHRDLLESVVFPDAYIAPEFQSYLATTADGRVHTGLLVQETTDAIYFRTAPSVRTRLSRRQIDDVMPTPTSLMPAGFDRLLTRQELSDLIEFLANQR